MSISGSIIVPHPPVIIPQVGEGREKAVQKTIDSYEKAAETLAGWDPETVVVITPHSILYRDYFHISPGAGAKGGMERFGVKGLTIETIYDEELAGEIEREGVCEDLPLGGLGEQDPSIDHGMYVPLYFINKYLSGYKTVRMSVSGLSGRDHYRLGQCIAKAADHLNRRVAIVASGDLSHCLKSEGPYEYAKEGPMFDRQVTEAMESGDFMTFLRFKESFCEKAGECGLRSFIVMAGTMDGRDVSSKLLSYEGPFGVGYGVAVFEPGEENQQRCFGNLYEKELKEAVKRLRETEDDYVRLARLSLESWVRDRKELKRPEGLGGELVEREAGVFVSLKKDGQLRGCIGTIGPTAPCIAEEIMHNAISAGVGDMRFDPVTEEELDDLVYSVDVLSDSEPVDSISQLDAKTYGVIVTKGSKRGLLLPNLEGVDSPEEQIEIALQKAGIAPDEKYKMERFLVVRHQGQVDS